MSDQNSLPSSQISLDLSNSGSEDFFSPLPPPLPPKTRPNTRSTNPTLASPLKVANQRKLIFSPTPDPHILINLEEGEFTSQIPSQNPLDSFTFTSKILNGIPQSSPKSPTLENLEQNPLSDISSPDLSNSGFKENFDTPSHVIQTTTMSAVAFLPHLPILAPHDTADKFIQDCDAFMSLLEEAEQIILTTFILIKLPEEARRAVDNQKATDWEAIKKALKTLTKKTRPAEDIQVELLGRNQRSGESLEKYGKVMMDLLSELTKAYSKELPAGQTLPPSVQNINERQALRAFETGIRSEQLRMLIFLNKSKDLADAVSCATAYESRNPKKGANSSDPPSTSNANSNTSKPTCESCKKFGHTAQNCRSKPIKVEPNGSQTFCNYCKETGHAIQDCRQRKENNLKKYGTENWAPPRKFVNYVQTNCSQNSPPGSMEQFAQSPPVTQYINPPGPPSTNANPGNQNQIHHIQTTQNWTPNPFQAQGNGQLRAGTVDVSARIEDCQEH